MFRKLLSLKLHEQSFFALIIAIGVISLWRGIWLLWDLHLIPNDPTLSAIVSVLIGLAILGATHYMVKELM
jgi:hypothetical protein